MKFSRIAAVPLALAAVAMLSCKKDSTGPASNLGTITCATGDASVCPPAGLTIGFNGTTGSPTITPGSSSTNISVSTSAYSVGGTTSSTANGYWFVVIGGTLRAWGVITVSGGTYSAVIPLFCGEQALVYRFDNTSGHSYWYAAATLTSCTTAAFRAQLTWDTGPSGSDIDLHLVRPSGTTNSANDCYYGNCVETGLTWGTTHPVLDVDNTSGYGPENITIGPTVESGVYRVIVYNYNGVLNTHATVKLYFNDVEVFRNTSVVLNSPNNWWTVATVNMTAQTFTSVNTYSSGAPAAPDRPAAVMPSKQ